MLSTLQPPAPVRFSGLSITDAYDGGFAMGDPVKNVTLTRQSDYLENDEVSLGQGVAANSPEIEALSNDAAMTPTAIWQQKESIAQRLAEIIRNKGAEWGLSPHLSERLADGLTDLEKRDTVSVTLTEPDQVELTFKI